MTAIGFNVKKPCADCPFKRSTPYHDGVKDDMPKNVEAIEEGRFAHTCHKTDNREACDGNPNYSGEYQHCAGAIIMLIK